MSMIFGTGKMEMVKNTPSCGIHLAFDEQIYRGNE